jgi:hypothetical protein
MPFKDLPDADRQGNDTPFGLAAGVWTRDLRKAHQAAAALDAGTVWVNCYNAFDNASPWGGIEAKRWGREKGPYGLDLFTQVKSVSITTREALLKPVSRASRPCLILMKHGRDARDTATGHIPGTPRIRKPDYRARG